MHGQQTSKKVRKNHNYNLQPSKSKIPLKTFLLRVLFGQHSSSLDQRSQTRGSPVLL